MLFVAPAVPFFIDDPSGLDDEVLRSFKELAEHGIIAAIDGAQYTAIRKQ